MGNKESMHNRICKKILGRVYEGMYKLKCKDIEEGVFESILSKNPKYKINKLIKKVKDERMMFTIYTIATGVSGRAAIISEDPFHGLVYLIASLSIGYFSYSSYKKIKNFSKEIGRLEKKLGGEI